MVSESHANANRAGFSVIALSGDLWGIELGFWSGEVWAQSGADFLHAEGATFDTTAERIHYQLAMQNATYTLYGEGAPILTGDLRNYSAHGNHVYSQGDFLFFGDNTTSAGAAVELGSIAVLESAVPEPAVLAVLSLGSLVLLIRRRSVGPAG